MEDSPSAAYIHQVHRLIEECILFNMNQEECKEALFKHANIKPVITSTVWKELEKENREFFDAYSKGQKEESSQTQKREKILNMVSASKNSSNDKFRV
ncbi:uncharacterized protein LOC106770367 [Vigna radiata var. radiata]|uniref:Uncharacterized protein LOC106770367 n=1 Tax=Vigna radiata var. radiata TaxID=3916 RepID=A0A1S3V007_VIGRR|nr:uncharacterized protein LOC106770367 [Vigna radiata var. radiata]XP_022640578.1 uncharacterized protein LOC106770367 [Vigna radiata var. radiata]